MKTKLILFSIGLLIVGLGATAKMKDGQVLKGNSLTDLGKYTIKKSEIPMIVENQAVVTYDLVYENASNPVKIGVISGKKSKTFLVRSSEFEAQYASNNGVFGVRKMDKKYRQLSEVKSDSKTNRVSLYAQRVISQKPMSEEDLLGLIACYFPNLVEKEYHAQF
jgi:hypothetical protein